MGYCYAVCLGGEWEAKAYPTPAEAWDRIKEHLTVYTQALEDAALVNAHAEWDIFSDRIAAESLKPWSATDLLEGPDGKWWGVSLEVIN